MCRATKPLKIRGHGIALFEPQLGGVIIRLRLWLPWKRHSFDERFAGQWHDPLLRHVRSGRRVIRSTLLIKNKLHRGLKPVGPAGRRGGERQFGAHAVGNGRHNRQA